MMQRLRSCHVACRVVWPRGNKEGRYGAVYARDGLGKITEFPTPDVEIGSATKKPSEQFRVALWRMRKWLRSHLRECAVLPRLEFWGSDADRDFAGLKLDTAT